MWIDDLVPFGRKEELVVVASSPTRVVRVAIVGGDGRIYDPIQFDDITVGYFTAEEYENVIAQVKGGRWDRVVVLTRWIRHAKFYALRALDVHVLAWPKGVSQLLRELRSIVGLDTVVPAPEPERVTPSRAYETWGETILEIMAVGEPGYAWDKPMLYEMLGVGPDHKDDVDQALRRLAELKKIVMKGFIFTLPLSPVEALFAPPPRALLTAAVEACADVACKACAKAARQSLHQANVDNRLDALEVPRPAVPVRADCREHEFVDGVCVVCQEKEEPRRVVPKEAPMAEPIKKVEKYLVVYADASYKDFTDKGEALAEIGLCPDAELYKKLKVKIRVEIDED